MIKLCSAFSFCVGLLILALAYFNAPGVSAVNAREGASTSCRVVEVALDEGYGVSRIELRRVCKP